MKSTNSVYSARVGGVTVVQRFPALACIVNTCRAGYKTDPCILLRVSNSVGLQESLRTCIHKVVLMLLI